MKKTYIYVSNYLQITTHLKIVQHTNVYMSINNVEMYKNTLNFFGNSVSNIFLNNWKKSDLFKD